MTWESLPWKRIAVSVGCLIASRVVYLTPSLSFTPAYMAAVLHRSDGHSRLDIFGSGQAIAGEGIGILGITQYVDALILMSLIVPLSVTVRTMLHSDGGRRRLEMWTRALTILMCLGAGWGQLQLLQGDGLLPDGIAWFPRLVLILEMTGGTMVLIFISDVMNDYGLGFGYAAFVIYAFAWAVTATHRFASLVAEAPSLEAMYGPLLLSALVTILLVMMSVAAALAWRRVELEKRENGNSTLRLTLLVTGVVRPVVFASLIVGVPADLANYFRRANANLAEWLSTTWQAYGPSPWIDLGYLLVNALLIIAFCAFIAEVDGRAMGLGRRLFAHVRRLSIATGVLIVVAVLVLPVMQRLITHAFRWPLVPVSGYEVVLPTVLLVLVVSAIERRGSGVALTRVPIPLLP